MMELFFIQSNWLDHQMESGFPSILLHVIAPFNVHVYLGLCKWLVFFASTNVHLAVSSSFIFLFDFVFVFRFKSIFVWRKKKTHTITFTEENIHFANDLRDVFFI